MNPRRYCDRRRLIEFLIVRKFAAARSKMASFQGGIILRLQDLA
jgi:hypothetical protein